MRHFQCDKCGSVNKAKLDGYLFGDRLLEGVMFEITIDANGKMSADTPDPHDKEYMDDLNVAKWNRAAVETAEDYDIFECSSCGNECDLVDD
jgi:hypothetical protein